MKNIIIVALLVAVGVFGYFQWQGKEQPNSNKARVKNRKTTEVIENRDIDFTVRVAGEISPADKVSVRPEVHGKIAATCFSAWTTRISRSKLIPAKSRSTAPRFNWNKPRVSLSVPSSFSRRT